jgi:hypothetical protein
MGIDSYLFMGYGFRIPKAHHERLLPRDDECPEYFTGDDIYTHDMGEGIFIFGKILYRTEARCYLWNGNREIVDVKNTLNVHHMVKRKIDRAAVECRRKAKFFILTVIS